LPNKPFNILRSFALLSLFAIGLIGIVSGIAISRFLASHMLQRDAVVTMEFIQSIAQAEEPELSFNRPELLIDEEGLGELFVHIAKIPDVVRANVYTPNRSIVWSTDKTLVGKRFEFNPELQRALTGQLVFELVSRGERHHKEEHNFFANDITDFVEFYIPIWNVPRTAVVGVAEVYKVPRALFRAMEKGKQLVWISAVAGGLFLYLALFWIVRRASNVIRGQQEQLAQDVDDHKLAEEILKKSESKLRDLSSRLLTAQEQERKRIASELHDGIGQNLSAIKFNVESGCARAASVECGAQRYRLVAKIQETMEEVRRISMDLRPSILDDLGILATLDWFCREFQEVYPHVEIIKRVELREDQIPEPLKIVVYRIVQEALNNVAKHANADQACLNLLGEEGAIMLRIRDNGKGFNVERPLPRDGHKSLGLRSMIERAELSGGRLSVKSNPSQGTVIEAVWS
jgi:signal transduction histidine kinase